MDQRTVLKKQPTLIYEGSDKKHFERKEGFWWPCILNSATHASCWAALNYLLPLLFHLSEACHYPRLALVHVLWYTAAWLQEQVRLQSVKSEASCRHMSGQTHSVTTAGFNTCVTVWNCPTSSIMALIAAQHNKALQAWRPLPWPKPWPPDVSPVLQVHHVITAY